MRYLLFTIVFLFGMETFASGEWINVTASAPSKPQVSLIAADGTQSTVHLKVDGFWKSEVQTSEGAAWLIDLGNNVRNLDKGAPALPYVSTSLIIPNMSKMKVEVVSSQFKEFKNVLIAPSKGNLYRDVDPATVPYEFGEEYGWNTDYPGTIARLNEPYIIRDYRGVALWINPFQYNPVTKILKVYYDIEVKVSEAGPAEINPLVRTKPLDKIDSRFNRIYKTHFLNYQKGSRYTPVEEHGNMLIISYGDFMDEMDPFVTWKTQCGTHVDMVSIDSVGNTATAIKQYVTNYYNDNGLTFLLLVGDAPQVHTSSVAGNDSDNDYTYIEGNDHYPDLFCGRFSAETESQVTTQVNRMIDYEKTPMVSDTTWFTQCLGIGSNQGTGDDGEYDWEHIRNIQQNKLLPYTYLYDYELYDGTHGGHDEPGDPWPADVSDAVNDGVTIINYCGHGSTTSWGTTGFSNWDVNNLTNAGNLPFIFSVACVNGNFKNNTCFAEAWLRATDNFGNPTGAISTIMSTINQSWDPPMCGQDAMNDILVETYPDNIKRTFGGVTMNGCMEMNDTYGSAGYKMTDTWTIFGDPSLMLRTAYPDDIAVTNPAMLMVGDSTMEFTCNVDGAIATLSMDGEILGSVTVSGDTNTINFTSPLSSTGSADFVVIAYNHVPYIDSIEIVSGNAPFIQYVDNAINDSLGNNNQMVDYNEDVFMTVYLENTGMVDAVDLISNISTSSPYVTITDTTENYGTVAPGDTVGIYNGYRFTVADSVPDMAEINFDIEAYDTSGITWNMGFSVIAHAPVLQYVFYEIDDSTTGNGNGRLDAGETASMKVYITNAGSAKAFNVDAVLTGDEEWITIQNNTMSYGDIDAGDTAMAVYTVTADADAPEGLLVWFDINMSADFNITGNGKFPVVVGPKPVVIIKLAPTLSADSLMASLAELSLSGQVMDSIPDNINDYKAAFVLLGVFSNNHVLTENEGQQLADYLNNGGKLYMEGGDTWAADSPTAVHPMFSIEGVEDGSNDLNTVTGDEATFMEGYIFQYQGANNYIDRIAPLDKAFAILTNMNPGYDAAIANIENNYRTIGASFEYGGLVDNDVCNKTGYLAEMLSFFGVPYIWTGTVDAKEEQAEVRAYPNPFNGTIHFDLYNASGKTATLSVFDLMGRVVYTTTTNRLSGNVRFNWNAAGNGVKQGVYFYAVSSGNSRTTGKIIYTR